MIDSLYPWCQTLTDKSRPHRFGCLTTRRSIDTPSQRKKRHVSLIVRVMMIRFWEEEEELATSIENPSATGHRSRKAPIRCRRRWRRFPSAGKNTGWLRSQFAVQFPHWSCTTVLRRRRGLETSSVKRMSCKFGPDGTGLDIHSERSASAADTTGAATDEQSEGGGSSAGLCAPGSEWQAGEAERLQREEERSAGVLRSCVHRRLNPRANGVSG